MPEIGLTILSFVVSGITLLSMWCLTEKWRVGFLLGIANQLLWAVLIISTDTWGLFILSAALVVVYARGWRKWGSHQVGAL